MKDSSAIVFFHKFEMFKLMINKLKLGFKPVDAATFAGFFSQMNLPRIIRLLCRSCFYAWPVLFSHDDKITVTFLCPFNWHRQLDHVQNFFRTVFKIQFP